MYKSLLILVVLLLVFPAEMNAQVVINEVLPNPQGVDDGAEWVELYNTLSQPFSLSGCSLYLHETDNNQKVVFDQEDFVDNFEVISWDGSWLNNNGDTIRLTCAAFSDKVTYGSIEGASVANPNEGTSIGRSPDGSGTFYILTSTTLGGLNSNPPTAKLLPTAAPTSTSRPTSTPKPTNIPVPTNEPDIVRNPTEIIEEVSTLPQKEKESRNDEVLGFSKDKGNNGDLSDKVAEKKNFPITALAFVLIGAGMISFPMIRFLKQIKKI